MVQSLLQGTRLNLDLPGQIIKNFNNTYAEIKTAELAKDEEKRKLLESDLNSQAEYFRTIGRKLIEQGIDPNKVPWAFWSIDKIRKTFQDNYNNIENKMKDEIQNAYVQNTILKYPKLSLDPERLKNEGNKYLSEEIKKSEYIDYKALLGEEETAQPNNISQTQPTETQTTIQPPQSAIPMETEPIQQTQQATSSQIQEYTIKSGDTISNLSKQFGISEDEILKSNPQIKNKNMIYAGEKLNIPQNQSVIQPAQIAKSLQATSEAQEQQQITQITTEQKQALAINPKPINSFNGFNDFYQYYNSRINNLTEILSNDNINQKTKDVAFKKIEQYQDNLMKLKLSEIAMNEKEENKLNEMKNRIATAVEVAKIRQKFFETISSEKSMQKKQERILKIEGQLETYKKSLATAKTKEKEKINSNILELETELSSLKKTLPQSQQTQIINKSTEPTLSKWIKK